MSRIFRCLVCLLLICCILVNLSPLKAKAVTPGVVAVGTISALVLIPAILYGLGVMQGADSSAFNQVVLDCNDFLTDAGYIVAGAATMLSLTQDGATITYAHRNMIQDVFDWLWSSSVVTVKQLAMIEGYNSPPAEALATAKAARYSFFSYTERVSSGYIDYVLVYSNESPIKVTITDQSTGCGYSIGTEDSSATIYAYLNDSWHSFTGLSHASNTSKKLVGMHYFGTEYSDEYVSTYDVTLGQIADQDTEIETGYETYIQEGIVSVDFGIQFEEGSPYNPDDDDEKKHFWSPIKLVPSENITTLTQEDAWSGLSEVELEYETVTDPDTGTDSGDGSGDNTGTDSGTNSGSWSPSGDMQHFTLDLKDYFPFCIPFDLYDFFTCLNADPVAPVIEWVIPLPGGNTYPLELDLSMFDSVAQLLRRLQLLLFCVGLAFKTRDLIKG